MKATGLKPIVGAIAISAFLIGCGGGSGSGASEPQKVEGSVKASVLKGVKVCVKDTNICSVTDSNGRFSLDTTYPANLEISVGDTKLGDVEVTGNTDITPALLADNNVTLAAYLGSLLHKAGGCSVTSYYCDLSKVKSFDLNASGDTLVDMINKAVKNGELYAKVDGKEVNVTLSDVDAYVTANPIISGRGEITYQGAMTLGDYAEFTFDLKDDVVNYQIKGNVLGKTSSKTKIYNMYNNLLYVNSDASNFYYLTSGVMFSTIMQNGKPYTVVGIPKNYIALSASDVAGKTYNILLRGVKIANETITSIGTVTLNANNTFVFVTKDFNGNAINVNGTWSFSDNKVYLKDSNGNDFMIMAVKKGYFQSIAIADFVNGGFGLGVESEPMSASDFTGYSYIKFIQNVGENKNEICLGSLRVKKVDDSHAQIDERDSKCFMVYINTNVNAVFFEEVPAEEPISYNAVINPTMEVNGNYISLNSVALSKEGVIGASIIDADNGIFAQLSMRDGKEVAILGSNKPIH
ncbi:hypothetical protein [Caminibacter pacificus]